MAATIQPPQFLCDLAERDDGFGLKLVGELDLSTVDVLRRGIEDLFVSDATMRRLVIDLSPLTFVDSSGLACLLKVAERARREGVELELTPGPPSVMRVFELTGTVSVLPFRPAARR